jgi:hypothetical protein
MAMNQFPAFENILGRIFVPRPQQALNIAEGIFAEGI